MPDTFTAKQVASRIGTDPKTLRKFLRSAASPYDAVGQGGRYEFPKGDLKEIKRCFIKWQGEKRPSTVPAKPINGHTKAPTTKPVDPDSARRRREAEFLEELEDDADREPTAEELDSIEDLVDDLEFDDAE